MTRTKLLLSVAVAVASMAIAAAIPSLAQSYREQPITIVVPVTPGGGTDTIIRLVLPVTASHAINVSLHPDMPFDPFEDLVPIPQLSSQPYLMEVLPELPVDTLEEFVTYNEKPESITYASSGRGCWAI